MHPQPKTRHLFSQVIAPHHLRRRINRRHERPTWVTIRTCLAEVKLHISSKSYIQPVCVEGDARSVKFQIRMNYINQTMGF